jgi:hypothetical protein
LIGGWSWDNHETIVRGCWDVDSLTRGSWRQARRNASLLDPIEEPFDPDERQSEPLARYDRNQVFLPMALSRHMTAAYSLMDAAEL